MTSPNEPGHPRAGEGPGSANGAPAGPPGRAAAESGDVPPWQRGPAARANGPRPAEQGTPPRPAEAPRVIEGQRPPETPRPTEAQRPPDAQRPTEAQRPPVRSPGTDARLGQFISGGPSTANRDTEVVPSRAPERPEGQRSENYASELPDLSAQSRSARPASAPAPAEQRPPAPAGRVQVAKKSAGPVRASMQIRRIDPWSTLKVSLVLSGALFFVWMIAVAFLYLVLGGMGVWTKLNSNVGDLLTSDSGTGGELISSGTIFGGATLIGLVNIVLLTAMATAGAFIYNLITDLVGGVEVTLADRD
ncbi:hypothetical protein ASE48_10205 [Mycobacterium sp. Root265]|uniref:DUF3566 domain-containing protein n=1 Tax=Mycobacterium sp. Root265 TaxID=1736504 RepID=UPI00070C461D|nr:DUF3566 domain-containing protein [Mycobacterium sp. Root265]KRD07797.1 hypothetical protein ASE48_10205 [Mycobacterium sp. Root265]